MLYITAKDAAEAKKIGTVLVTERLAACANIIPTIDSVYWWKGALETGTEALVTLKTKESLAERAIKRAQDLHSYECPCIVAFPIVNGSVPFLQWISNETS